jgi:hypothetical protein
MDELYDDFEKLDFEYIFYVISHSVFIQSSNAMPLLMH